MKRPLLFILVIIAWLFGFNSYCQEVPCGIGAGVLITHRSEGDRLQITQVIPNSPAAQAGLEKNQIIGAIDGVPTIGLKLKDCLARLQGKLGTKVLLQIEDRLRKITNSVEVVRKSVLNDPSAVNLAEWVGKPGTENRKSLSVGLNQAMRVSNSNRAIAIIQFTKFGTTNAFYRWRFRQNSYSPVTTGTGVVFEDYNKRVDAAGSATLVHLGNADDLTVKAGSYRLDWSSGSITNGWLYYDLLIEKVEVSDSTSFDSDLK